MTGAIGNAVSGSSRYSRTHRMHTLFRLTLAAAATASLLPWTGQVATAQGAAAGLRIAVVDLNTALNESEAGKRSKKILRADKAQMESELKAKETSLKEAREELDNNILLTGAARAEREDDLRNMERQLRNAVQQAQKELQDKERRYTETIFNELKTVINLVSKEDGWDIVLEKASSQVILYSSFEMEDITDKVIERYKQIQTVQ